MNHDVQIFFHNIEQTDSLVDAVDKRLRKLARYCGHIITGRIVIDSPHNHHHKGKVYSVNIDIHFADSDVRVSHEQHDKSEHEDLYVAIRDAFNIAERQFLTKDKKHRKKPLRELDLSPDSEEAA